MDKFWKFNPQTDDWNMYIEQLKLFFEANNVSDDSKKRAILLSSYGTVTYKLFKGLTAPGRLGEKGFEEPKTPHDTTSTHDQT